MIRLLTLSTTFNAIHQHGFFPVGHRFIVRATIPVGSDPVPLRHALDQIRVELKERQIEKMLPGVDPSVMGLANWAFERLSGPIPKLDSVSVSEDTLLGDTATVTRTVG